MIYAHSSIVQILVTDQSTSPQDISGSVIYSTLEHQNIIKLLKLSCVLFWRVEQWSAVHDLSCFSINGISD